MTHCISNSENFERLKKVVSWTSENKELWNAIVYRGEDGISLSDINRILDHAKHHGFMELYLFVTMKCIFNIDMPIEDEEFMERLVAQFAEEAPA